MQGKIKMRMNLAPLKRLERKSPGIFRKAMEKGAVQFLTWANKGSKMEPGTPPIRWGVLRGSSSTFVGNKLVKTFAINIKSGAPERPTPATSGAKVGTIITWVWNTLYAWKMHEWKVPPGKWGKFTKQAGNAGNKWLEKHLKADRDALMEVIKTEFIKEAGM